MGALWLLAQPKEKRTTTNLKTKSNQNCQKIELYGSLTTKELKKKHSSRLVGGAEMGRLGGKDLGKAAACRPVGKGSGWWSRQAGPTLVSG